MEKESTIPKGGFSEGSELEASILIMPTAQALPFAKVIAVNTAFRILPLLKIGLTHSGIRLETRTNWSLVCFGAAITSRAQIFNASANLHDSFLAASKVFVRFANGVSLNASTAAFSQSTTSDLLFHTIAKCLENTLETDSSPQLIAQFCSTSVSQAADATLIAGTETNGNYHRPNKKIMPAHIWAAVTADARALEAGATPFEMTARSLWPENSPYQPQFDRETFLAAAPSFEVWLDWYESIVDGKAPWGLPRDIANKLEERIALGDGRGEGGKDFWYRDADVVNAEIKSWVEKARAEVAEHLSREQQQDEQNLVQRPAPHQFDKVGGKIIAFPMKTNRQPDDLSADMWEELHAKASATRARLERTQAPKHVIHAFDRLIAGLGDGFSDIRPGKLLMQSNTIDAIAASYDSPEMQTELAGDCLTLIKDISESLTDFKALFPEILDIEAMRLAQRIAGESTNPILVQTRQIAVFAAASEVIDASVLAAFDAAFAEIDEQERLAASGGNDTAIAEANKKKAETTALHALDVRNFVARVLKSRVAIGAVNAGSKLTKDVAKNTYKGALSAVEETSKASTKLALAFLISQFTGILPAIAIYMLSFAPLAKKAAEIAAGDPGKVGPQ